MSKSSFVSKNLIKSFTINRAAKLAHLTQPTRVLLSSGQPNAYEYQIYEPSKVIRKSVSIQNTSIEGLMGAILGADTQEKLNATTLGGARNAEQKNNKDFEKIRNQDKEKTYFELISKLEIKSLGQHFAIVKFKIHLEQAPNGITGAYQLQKVGTRWYKTSRSDLSEIALMMIFFKPSILKELLENKISNEPLMQDLEKKVKDSNGLDFKKLYKEFSKWETDKQKKEYFLEPTGW